MINAILTIDDMPQKNTKAIVDYLYNNGIKAVFFTIGEMCDNDPDSVIYAIKKGFVVGNHTYTHAKLSEVTYDEAIEEIEKCEVALNRVYEMAGVERPVKLFRFPYLDQGPHKTEILKYLTDNGFKKVDDANVINEWYIGAGWKEENHVSCSFDCEEYMLRPGNTKKFSDIMESIDKAFGEDKRDQDHIILTHSHDETEEMESEYYRKICERILANGAKFIEPKFV